MVSTERIRELVHRSDGVPNLDLTAEGQFHVVLGTKNEHDGVKVQAMNATVIDLLLDVEYFRIEKYYCRTDAGDRTFEPGEFEDEADTVVAIDGLEGMLPYDAVSIGRSGDEHAVADLLSFVDAE